jgi:hypothetical protein
MYSLLPLFQYGYTNLALSAHSRYIIIIDLHKHSMIPLFIMQREPKKAVVCAGC